MNPPSHPNYFRKRVLLAFLSVLSITGCGGQKEAETQAPNVQQVNQVVLGPRDVAAVKEGSIEEGVVLTGTLEPYLRVEVKAQLSGVLTRIGPERGQTVREGALLASIDAEGVRSQATSAQAGVASARSALAFADRQLESARTLYEAGALSQIEYEQARTQYDAAKAQVSAAEAAATGSAEQASRTTVRAPISGTVSERLVEAGEVVSPGQTLYTLVNSSSLELHGNVPVSQAIRLRAGQPAEFTLEAVPGRVFRGTVSRIEPTADPESRQIGIYLRMQNPGNLVGGLFATGRILSDVVQNALLVPQAALRGEADAPYVYVVDNNRILRKTVTVTTRDNARGVVAVAGQVKAGDLVLVSPSQEVEEGTPVKVTRVSSSEPVPSDSAKVQ